MAKENLNLIIRLLKFMIKNHFIKLYKSKFLFSLFIFLAFIQIIKKMTK